MRSARTTLAVWLGGALLFGLPACSSAPRQPEPAYCVERIRPEKQELPAETNQQEPVAGDTSLFPIPAETTPPSLDEASGPLSDESPAQPVWGRKLREVPACAWGEVCEFASASWQDQLQYYSAHNLGLLALGVAVAAPLANTPVDREFQEWYQRRVRSHGLDRCSEWGKVAGEHLLVVPVYLGAACLGRVFDDTAAGSALNAWGNRTLRAMIVGAPSVGALQYGLGAGRPEEGGSRWQPFQDNNAVAGHGFIGAVPFLTAASLTENSWLRGPLVAASFVTCWSRVNDDAHYLSQAFLGWWIAYLSVRSVDDSDRTRRTLHLLPGPDGSLGASVLVEY